MPRRRKQFSYSHRQKRRILENETSKDYENVVYNNLTVNESNNFVQDNLPQENVSQLISSAIVCDGPSNHCDDSSSDDSSSDDNRSDESCISLQSTNSEDEDTREPEPQSKSELFKREMKLWALRFGIHLNALTFLLSIISKYTDLDLPSDARTMMKTPRSVEISNIGGGLYWHYGLKNVLKNMYSDLISKGVEQLNQIKLYLNIDGLPLSKSSNSSFWPILLSESIIKKVHVVGCFFGLEKPKNSNEFLTPLVDELVDVTSNGFVVNNIKINVSLDALICDTPAKSFVLKIKGHSGYSSCTKCTIHGDYIDNRVCFPAAGSNSRVRNRSDEDFKNMIDENYHAGYSILNEIPNFGLVSNVPLDYMHLVCLGVVKKLVSLWLCGALTYRLSGNMISQISQRLLEVKQSIPNEFERKPRELLYWKQWKATEYRQFLLYTGVVVLKGIVQKNIYQNFMALHIAIKILSRPDLVRNEIFLNYAKDLLDYFVKTYTNIYGKKNVSHNVHNLAHLVGDVEKFGAIDNFSAFRFESFMFKIKKTIRKNERPLQQFAKRHLENEDRQVMCGESENDFVLLNKHSLGPLGMGLVGIDQQYHSLKGRNLFLNCNDKKNNVCLLKDGSVVEVTNIVQLTTKQIIIVFLKYKTINSLYRLGTFESMSMGIKAVSDLSTDVKYCLIEDIICKVWRMPNKSCIAVFPLSLV